jgi:hypothetical protein
MCGEDPVAREKINHNYDRKVYREQARSAVKSGKCPKCFDDLIKDKSNNGRWLCKNFGYCVGECDYQVFVD